MIKSPGLAGIFEKPANLGFFLFVEVFVANQTEEVYLPAWIFDHYSGIGIPSLCNKNECIYDFYKDSIICWPINPEKPSSLLVEQLT